MLVRDWEFVSSGRLYRWYGRVHFDGADVLGQWFRVDASSGHCIWESRLRRPNTITATTDNWIIASETRSDGPWTDYFGVYGIRRDTGELAWKSHADGWLGRVCDALDRFKFLTNELRDTPERVVDQEVHCTSGRVLDIESGRLIRRDPRAEQTSIKTVRCESRHVVETSAGRLVLETANETDHQRFKATLRQSFDTVWSFDIQDENRFISSWHRPWLVDGHDLLLVVSEQPDTVPVDPKQPMVVRRNATQYELWQLDLDTGKTIAMRQISQQAVEECRIEDANAGRILVSQDNSKLTCFSYAR